MSKQDLETFLFKNRLNSKTLTDLLNILSDETTKVILNDLNKNFIESATKTKLYVFTDGGCINNGRIGSRAAFSTFFPDFPNLNKTCLLHENPTNQRAELSAINCALENIIKNIDLFNNKNVTIYTDSSYSIKCITEWSKNWERNGWRTSNGKPVKNQELIQSITENINKIKNITKNTDIDTDIDIEIEFKHVFSHTAEPKHKYKDSKEYKIWLGNKTVDDQIQQILKNS